MNHVGEVMGLWKAFHVLFFFLSLQPNNVFTQETNIFFLFSTLLETYVNHLHIFLMKLLVISIYDGNVVCD